MDIPGQLARYTVYLTTIKPSASSLSFCFRRGYGLRKDAEIPVAHHAIHSPDIPDHIVIQDPDNIPLPGLGIGRQSFTTVQALFLPGEAHINYAVFKFVFAKHAGGLYGAGHSTGIVIGSGGV